MARIIERSNGVITQFQGDAVLAVFNVPIRDRDHAAHALAAAIEMIRVTDERDFAGVRVRNRIGISTGRMLAGAVGSRGRLTYTVHGNTVNVASRIEAMKKAFGTRILLSAKTAERCPGVELRRVSEVEVRGYDEPVTLFAPDVTSVAVHATGIDRESEGRPEQASVTSRTPKPGHPHRVHSGPTPRRLPSCGTRRQRPMVFKRKANTLASPINGSSTKLTTVVMTKLSDSLPPGLAA